ncbi:ATP-binding protein [Desulfonatronovibrio hydrogenovorans]|uniref:ATP-binding protein n=1 Tax=Desulfonatronovibrio hydrogenovorans TaxID=53245 RepID=UPI000490DEFC|nr:transporter substrate-binding domain-containing protein [Desulfonatronovibrio hydrogenovorans]
MSETWNSKISIIAGSLFWILILLAPCIGKASFLDTLSSEEREWLDEMDGKIRVAPDPYFPPLEYFDDEGRFLGIAADYVRIMEQKLEISFEIVRLSNFEEVLDQAARRGVDMVNTVIETPERSRYLSFTRPYIEIPNVIVVSDNISTNLTVDDLKEMRDVVYQGGYAVGPYLMEKHGLYHLRPITDPAQALVDLSTGQIQAMVGNLGVISYYVRSLNIPNLRVAGDCRYNDVLAFAARSDWPVLRGILDKVLADISDAERKAIEKEWIGLELPMFYHDLRFWLGVSGVVLILLLIIALLYAWNRTLKHQVALRVAAHQQAQEELAHEVLRRRILVEQSRDGIVVLDEKGGVHEANKQFAEMLGYSEEELKGLHVWDWDGLWSREELLQMISKADSSGETFETNFRCQNGTRLDVEISTNGAVIKGRKYVFCVCRDITLRKRNQKELSLKNEQLREVMAQKDKFFSIIAHDLKSPISGMLSLATYLDQEVRRLSRDELKEISAHMRTSTENINNLLNNLLEWGRAQKGVLHYDPRVFSLKPLIQEEVELARAGADQKQISIEVDVPGDIQVLADREMTGTVFRNLLSNAVKFTSRKGVIIISARQDQDTGEALVQVRDNGAGLDAERLSGIFSGGCSRSQPGTEGEKGTGFGLSLCKEFVEKMGGDIRVESKPGQGTMVSFTLPLVRIRN